MGKKLLIVVTVGLVALWWLVRYWQPDTHVHVGQFLALHVNNDNVNIRLSSPDGSTRLRGTLGGSVDGGNVVSGSVKSCSGGQEGGCVEMKVAASDTMTESLLRLDVAQSGESRHGSITITVI